MELSNNQEEILKYSQRAEKTIFIIAAVYCIFISCLYAIFINDKADSIYFYLWHDEDHRRIMDRIAILESLLFWIGSIVLAMKISSGSEIARIIMGLWMLIRGAALVPFLVVLYKEKELHFIPSHLAIIVAALFGIICGIWILFSKCMRVATARPK